MNYFDLPGMSFSQLKDFAESPALYLYRRSVGRSPTPEMELGSLTHSLILETDSVGRDYAVWEGGRRAGKEYTEFCQLNSGRSVVKREDYDFACKLAERVKNDPVAGGLLAGLTHKEHVIRWQMLGLDWKAKVDGYDAKNCICIDVKTTTNSRRQFQYQIPKLKYHWQGAIYSQGLESVGMPVLSYILIAIGKNENLEVNCYQLSDDYLSVGRVEVSNMVDRFLDCRTDDHWPSYGGGELVVLDPPLWSYESE